MKTKRKGVIDIVSFVFSLNFDEGLEELGFDLFRRAIEVLGWQELIGPKIVGFDCFDQRVSNVFRRVFDFAHENQVDRGEISGGRGIDFIRGIREEFPILGVFAALTPQCAIILRGKLLLLT